ncbi:MAG: 7TM diverse intracellular signaling domain-containing protein [Nitritalea sp.]
MRAAGLLFVLWLKGFCCLGQQNLPIELAAIDKEFIFTRADVPSYADTSQQLSLDEILLLDRTTPAFRVDPTASKANFSSTTAYWLRLPLTFSADGQSVHVLEFYDQRINALEVYVPRADGGYQMWALGSDKPFRERLFYHKNFHVLLPQGLSGEQLLYVRIVSQSKADVRLALRTYERFLYYALNEYLFYGLFYGMIFMIAIYNLIVFLAVREIKYVYYILYLLSVAFLTMSLDGIGYQFFWPNYSQFNGWASGIFSFLVILFAVIFTMHFLGSRKRAPFLHKLLWASLALKSVYFVYGLFVNIRFLELSYVDVLPFLLIFLTGALVWREGMKSARLFVLAYGILFVGAFIKLLGILVILAHTTLVYYSLHLAFLLEMFMLSFALGDRIRILKALRDQALRRSLAQYKENIALKEKVNQELEAKVRQRTEALERKNQQLEEVNFRLQEKDEEIKRINALLDRDNWKLKSTVKSSLEARLTNTSLSYEEFQKVFPDTAACNRHLEQLKWEKGFQCKRCGGEKASRGQKLFQKRCSKCGYVESVTTATLFQGIRFPLEKAFYIAYLAQPNKPKVNLDSLSSTLQLRKSTVSSFRKKVRERLAILPEANWQHLILLDEKPLDVKSK